MEERTGKGGGGQRKGRNDKERVEERGDSGYLRPQILAAISSLCKDSGFLFSFILDLASQQHVFIPYYNAIVQRVCTLPFFASRLNGMCFRHHAAPPVENMSYV